MPQRFLPFFAIVSFLFTGESRRGLAQETKPEASKPEVSRPAISAKDIDAGMSLDWYGMYLKGKKIGYFRTGRARVGDQISESVLLAMKLASFGQKAELSIHQDLRFAGQAPYELISGSFEQKSGTTGQKIQVTKNDKGYELVTTTSGEKSVKQIKPVDFNLADAMASEIWLKRAPKVGDVYVFKSFDMQDQKLYDQTAKVLGTKTSLVAGVNVRYFEVEAEGAKERLKIVSLFSDQGKMLSGNFAVFELRLETEAQAKDTEYSQDLFVLGMVKVNKSLGPTKQVAELVVRTAGKEAAVFEDGPRQKIEPAPGGGFLIKLGKKYGTKVKATEKEIEESLQETNAYCISHPKVKALADKAIGDAKTPEEKVRRIVDFVHDFVDPNLSATMPNIHDLMEKKKGDCKSYALLVTNLARAAGVPARDVSGLLYIGDDSKAFGGHAWNEVVLGGVWVPVDASLRQTEVDATHLSYGHDYKAAKNLLETLGKLSFELVEVKSK